ncbi:aldo/keto reductase [Streptomyces sp. NPDC048473]|uniref:aldo/keto reductase n=1 Tax=unclassified Streptomyces TaxID=2593676 RepID=UPI003722809D
MHNRRIGSAVVSAIGLGGMPLSIEGRPDEERAVATIHAALDAGITFIDTAMSYCLNSSETGHNESLIARALAAYGADTSEVLVGTKGGAAREADGAWSFNGDPATLREACEGSLKRLGVDALGLYQLHVPDPNVPYADSGISRAGGLGSSYAAFARIAEEREVSPQKVCLAWELAKSPVVVPISGSSRPATIRDSAAAADLKLTDAEFAELDAT